MRKAALYAAGVAVTLFMAGCTGAGEQPEPVLGAVPVIVSEAEITLPLAGYEPSASARIEVDRARLTLRTRCAERFSVRATGRLAEPPVDLSGRRYGIVDAATVQRFGYRLPPVSTKAASTTSSRPKRLSAGPSWTTTGT